MQREGGAAADEQRHDEEGGPKEEQAQHEGDLTQGERVDVPAELQVDDEDIGKRVADRDDPPLELERRIERWHVADRSQKHDRDGRESPDEEPDATGTGDEGQAI